jgi:predicted enzyme related to lactoylglutathione lyase
MLTNGLFEIIIYVADMHSQVVFYRDVMGLQLAHPSGLTDYSDQHWVVFETGGCRLALHAGGHAPAAAGSPKLVFAVADIATARADLADRGLQLDETFSPAPGVEVANGRDPEGNPLSIESHAAG